MHVRTWSKRFGDHSHLVAIYLHITFNFLRIFCAMLSEWFSGGLGSAVISFFSF